MTEEEIRVDRLSFQMDGWLGHVGGHQVDVVLGLEVVLRLEESHHMCGKSRVVVVLLQQLGKIHSLSRAIVEGEHIVVLQTGNDTQELLDREERIKFAIEKKLEISIETGVSREIKVDHGLLIVHVVRPALVNQRDDGFSALCSGGILEDLNVFLLEACFLEQVFDGFDILLSRGIGELFKVVSFHLSLSRIVIIRAADEKGFVAIWSKILVELHIFLHSTFVLESQAAKQGIVSCRLTIACRHFQWANHI